MHKASIFEETSEVIHQEAFEENQFVITLKAPKALKRLSLVSLLLLIVENKHY